jgi:hypothetical protein
MHVRDRMALGFAALASAVVVADGAIRPAGAAPSSDPLYIVSVEMTDAGTLSVVVAAPTAPMGQLLAPSSFSVAVDGQPLEVVVAEPLAPSDLTVGLVLDDSHGVTHDVLGQQQAALVEVVRLLEPGTYTAVGTSTGRLLAPPTVDKATMIGGIAAATPTAAGESPTGPAGLFEGVTGRRQLVTIDVEPSRPLIDVAEAAAVSMVRLDGSGAATVETWPSPNALSPAAGPATLLAALDQVGASLTRQYRLTTPAPDGIAATMTVSLTQGPANFTATALLPVDESAPVAAAPAGPVAGAPAGTTEPATGSGGSASTAPTPVGVPAAGAETPSVTASATDAPTTAVARPEPRPPRSTPAGPVPAPTIAPEGAQELAIPRRARGGGGAPPVFILAGMGAVLAAGTGVGLLALRRRPVPERVYVRAVAPYRHGSERTTAARRHRRH